MLMPTMGETDDGLIGRCHPGDCHDMNGNYQGQRRVDTLQEILKSVGMDENRV
jgi:F420-non-reducing hydrogenase iron-sulfur subunit